MTTSWATVTALYDVSCENMTPPSRRWGLKHSICGTLVNDTVHWNAIIFVNRITNCHSHCQSLVKLAVKYHLALNNFYSTIKTKSLRSDNQIDYIYYSASVTFPPDCFVTCSSVWLCKRVIWHFWRNLALKCELELGTHVVISHMNHIRDNHT